MSNTTINTIAHLCKSFFASVGFISYLALYNSAKATEDNKDIWYMPAFFNCLPKRLFRRGDHCSFMKNQGK